MTLCPEKQDWLLQGEPQIQSRRGTPGSSGRQQVPLPPVLSTSTHTSQLLLLLAFAKQEEQQTTLIKYSLVDLRDPTYKIIVGKMDETLQWKNSRKIVVVCTYLKGFYLIALNRSDDNLWNFQEAYSGKLS